VTRRFVIRATRWGSGPTIATELCRDRAGNAVEFPTHAAAFEQALRWFRGQPRVEGRPAALHYNVEEQRG
jgi:hypothetical protein